MPQNLLPLIRQTRWHQHILLDVVHCLILVTVSVHHSRQGCCTHVFRKSRSPETSSPYTRYIGLVLPSIEDSIPYEHISAIEKLHNYLFPMPVHRSPSFYNSSTIHLYTIDFCRVHVNFIPSHSPMYLQELNPFIGPEAESSSSLSRPWSLNLSRSCREVANFGTLL